MIALQVGTISSTWHTRSTASKEATPRSTPRPQCFNRQCTFYIGSTFPLKSIFWLMQKRSQALAAHWHAKAHAMRPHSTGEKCKASIMQWLNSTRAGGRVKRLCSVERSHLHRNRKIALRGVEWRGRETGRERGRNYRGRGRIREEALLEERTGWNRAEGEGRREGKWRERANPAMISLILH